MHVMSWIPHARLTLYWSNRRMFFATVSWQSRSVDETFSRSRAFLPIRSCSSWWKSWIRVRYTRQTEGVSGEIRAELYCSVVESTIGSSRDSLARPDQEWLLCACVDNVPNIFFLPGELITDAKQKECRSSNCFETKDLRGRPTITDLVWWWSSPFCARRFCRIHGE